MINKLIKKIGFICLGLASLALAGCFHIPDEDWLPSKNKVETGNTHKDDEINQAFDSFVNDFNSISNQRNEMKDDESDGSKSEDLEESSEIEDETTNEENQINSGSESITEE